MGKNRNPGNIKNEKVVFFGTPYYVLPILEKINRDYQIEAVVTASPKPVGRKKIIEYSAVDKWAHQRKIPIFYNPEDLKKANRRFTFGILAAYGKIIPQEVIGLFQKGILNVHPSLLPQFRGASPVQAAIATGQKKTGVTVILLNEKLDQGPILSFFEEPIKSEDTTQTLRERLFLKSADFLKALIPPYLKGKVRLKPQDESKASFTSILKKEHAFLPPKIVKKAILGQKSKTDINLPFIKDGKIKANPKNLERLIRAFFPWPIAYTFVRIGKKKKRLQLIKATIKQKKLVLERVKLEGKKEVNAQDFFRFYQAKEIFE